VKRFDEDVWLMLMIEGIAVDVWLMGIDEEV